MCIIPVFSDGYLNKNDHLVEIIGIIVSVLFPLRTWIKDFWRVMNDYNVRSKIIWAIGISS